MAAAAIGVVLCGVIHLLLHKRNALEAKCDCNVVAFTAQALSFPGQHRVHEAGREAVIACPPGDRLTPSAELSNDSFAVGWQWRCAQFRAELTQAIYQNRETTEVDIKIWHMRYLLYSLAIDKTQIAF